MIGLAAPPGGPSAAARPESRMGGLEEGALRREAGPCLASRNSKQLPFVFSPIARVVFLRFVKKGCHTKRTNFKNLIYIINSMWSVRYGRTRAGLRMGSTVFDGSDSV